MIKKITLIFLLLLSCYCAHTFCMDPPQKEPSVAIEEITNKGNEYWGEDDEEKETEDTEEVDTEVYTVEAKHSYKQRTLSLQRLLGLDLDPDRRTKIYIKNAKIANTMIEPRNGTIISGSLKEIPQACTVLIGSKVGEKIIEKLTTDPSVSRTSASAVEIVKLSLKLRHLNATSAVIHAKRAPIQEAIFQKLKEDAQNNGDTPNNPENDAHLHEVSMQEALRIEPLSPEEREALKKSWDTVVKHLCASLEKY